MDEGKQALTEKIVSFLAGIGIRVIRAELHEQTFLPGIMADRGAILIDGSKLLYPGDLLHEAGHLAVISPERRERAKGNMGKDRGEEMMAIAWSYAACVHLGLEPSVVFHDGGYHGWSGAFIENFANGRYVGVPMLQWIGLTADSKRAKELGEEPYPHMIKWLLD
jgi:hypothetical protein